MILSIHISSLNAPCQIQLYQSSCLKNRHLKSFLFLRLLHLLIARAITFRRHKNFCSPITCNRRNSVPVNQIASREIWFNITYEGDHYSHSIGFKSKIIADINDLQLNLKYHICFRRDDHQLQPTLGL